MIACSRKLCLLPLLLLLCALPGTAKADEGMWLHNQPPRAILNERYGFEPSAAWLDHLRKASANVNGASGSFVSREGLLLSNQHVVSRVLQRMSTAQRNLVSEGFYARKQTEELPCPGLEVTVMMEIEDVTAQVNSAVRRGMSDQEAFRARRAAMAKIESESRQRTGLRSQVVTLFQGGQYHLYRTKHYTDVRLVFAPEDQIAFFGADVDNFEYPRWNLDIVFLRAYENGKPARVSNYLAWSTGELAENDLVFMSGHPARTDRLRTATELKYLRDVEYPRALQRLKRIEVLLAAFSKRSVENARRARADLRVMENSRKRRDGTLAGLLDPALMERKMAHEAKLRAAAQKNTDFSQAQDAWDRIATAQQEIASGKREYDFLETGWGFNTHLFTHARRLLRAASERQKPEGERLEEYRASSLPSIEVALAAEQPYYNDLESAKLADSLTFLAEQFGPEHPLVRRVLDGKTPRERALECVSGTQLASAAVRRRLFAEPGLVESSSDPMIELARLIDPEARAARAAMDTRVEAVRQAHAQIARLRYAVEGDTQYPDATGTLRLGFGTIKGIPQDNVPAVTVYRGLYERAGSHNCWPPFNLPKNWLDAKSKLDLNAPMNLISTCDTLGGNSGSPLVNRKGELVGVVFDGNIHSLVLDVEYTEERARSVAVHAEGIIEALRRVYSADPLVAELVGKQR